MWSENSGFSLWTYLHPLYTKKELAFTKKKKKAIGDLKKIMASLVAQVVRNLPALQETWVQSLGWEDPLGWEEHTPVFFPGGSHGLRSLVGYSPWGCKESDTTERISTVQHSIQD